MIPSLLTLCRRDGDRLARRGRRRRPSRAAPRRRRRRRGRPVRRARRRRAWAPSGSSRCRGTSPARRSPASSAPPTSSPSAARRAPRRSRELTGGVGARRRARVRRHRRVDAAGASRSPAPARPSASSGVPHGVELPIRADVPAATSAWPAAWPRCASTSPSCSSSSLAGAIDPGLVFDLTLPLDEVAEGYRAMDERRGDQGPAPAMTVHRRRTGLRPRAAAALRRRDLGDHLGGDRRAPRPSPSRAGSAAWSAADVRASTATTTRWSRSTGLEPGTHRRRTPCDVDDERVWPPAGRRWRPVPGRR